jgi:hypothetical protein
VIEEMIILDSRQAGEEAAGAVPAAPAAEPARPEAPLPAEEVPAEAPAPKKGKVKAEPKAETDLQDVDIPF